MKQQIDHLIANHLLDEGEVYLPKVGTLILSHHAAKLLSAKQLQRPYRELRITAEERGESIVTHIARIAKLSDERANDIYNEWLAQSQRNDTVTIGELCTIEKGKVTTDKTFELMANPQGRGTVKVNPRTNYLIYIIAGLCMGFALGIAGYVLHTNGTFDKLFGPKQYCSPEEEYSETGKVPEGYVLYSPKPIVGTAARTVLLTVAEYEEAMAKEAAEAAAEAAAPMRDGIPEGIIQDENVLPMQKGSSYAVWGVYNELSNAEKAKEWLAERIPDITAEIYQYDARYMVALCEMQSRTECGRKVSAWKAQHKSFANVWVYTR